MSKIFQFAFEVDDDTPEEVMDDLARIMENLLNDAGLGFKLHTFDLKKKMNQVQSRQKLL